MNIILHKSFFNPQKRKLLEDDKFSVYTFKYDTGVEALRIENRVGYIVVLPYQGQVVWDAVFYGRSLKMKTSFSKPKKTNIFGETYGCYLMHCGMTSMGVPKKDDDHPPHGHLPFANMKDAYLEIGKDNVGDYVELFSTFERNIALGEHYTATPSVRLYEDSSILRVHIHSQNLSRKKMTLMYLCHINNRLVPGAKIYQTLDWDKSHMAIQELPQDPDSDLKRLHERIGANPETSNPILEKDYYDPEICFFLRNLKSDKDNYSHFLYELPNGSGDYTYFDSSILNHGVRWIAYHEDCESMGMVLPATAESEGFHRELKKNNMRYLDSMESFNATVFCGALTPEEVIDVKKLIASI